MLIEFRSKNFRSLRDEQVFSLVASADKDQLGTHTLNTGHKVDYSSLHSVISPLGFKP